MLKSTRTSFSIATTLYRSSLYLPEFVQRCEEVMHQLAIDDYELVMVNDGCPADSLITAIKLQQNHPKIKVLDLTRNFGHHAAALAALRHCKGELVFLIDCDLETPPEVLLEFYALMKRQPELDVVYGYQENRKGGALERISGGLFWRFINWASDVPIPHNIVTERLMKRNYVGWLTALQDRNLFLAGMMYWVGGRQAGIVVQRTQRKGKSTYTLRKRMNLMFIAVTALSSRPLTALFYLGSLLTIGSFGYGSYLLLRKLFFPASIQPGYASLATLMLFSTGIIVAAIGVLGIYISKIFNQTLARPPYIIRETEETP